MLVGTILCNGLDLKNRVNFESLNAPQQGSHVEPRQSVGSLLCSEFQLAEPRAGDAAAPAAPQAAALPSREGNAPAATGLSLELPFPQPQSHGISWAGKAPQGPSRGDLWSSSSWECPTADTNNNPTCAESLAKGSWSSGSLGLLLLLGVISAPHHQSSRGKGRAAAAQRRGEGGLSTPCTTQLPHCWGILLQL